MEVLLKYTKALGREYTHFSEKRRLGRACRNNGKHIKRRRRSSSVGEPKAEVILLRLALPGPAAATGQDKPELLLSGNGGVTGSEGSRVQGVGLLRAASPYQN